MTGSGQSSRGQFQIGNSSLRSRRPCRRSRAELRGVGLSRLFASSDVTSYSTPAASHCNSNRNSAETGFAVTPTKQTTVVLSNRNKKTPPRGVPSELRLAVARGANPTEFRWTGRAVCSPAVFAEPAILQLFNPIPHALPRRSGEDRRPACPDRSGGEPVRRGGRAEGPTPFFFPASILTFFDECSTLVGCER